MRRVASLENEKYSNWQNAVFESRRHNAQLSSLDSEIASLQRTVGRLTEQVFSVGMNWGEMDGVVVRTSAFLSYLFFHRTTCRVSAYPKNVMK